MDIRCHSVDLITSRTIFSIVLGKPSQQRLAMLRSSRTFISSINSSDPERRYALMIPYQSLRHFHFFVLISLRAKLLCLIAADTGLPRSTSETKSRASESTNEFQLIP
jgi:hypothetical protein